MPQPAQESKHLEDVRKVPADALIALMASCGAVRRQVELMVQLAPLSGTAAIAAAVSALEVDLNSLRSLVRQRIEELRTDRAIAAGSLEDDENPGPIALELTRQQLRAAIARCECRIQPSFRHGCSQCNPLRDQLAASFLHE